MRMEALQGRGFSITRCRYLNGQGGTTAVNGCYGKTFQELFPQTKEMTLDTFLDQWYKGMFLSLKTDGRTQESVSPKMETESWSGGCWTLNISESLNDDVESSLYSILEHGGGTRRYCLSPKACEGILRRAKEHSKVLPPLLEKTLQKMAALNGMQETLEEVK